MNPRKDMRVRPALQQHYQSYNFCNWSWACNHSWVHTGPSASQIVWGNHRKQNWTHIRCWRRDNRWYTCWYISKSKTLRPAWTKGMVAEGHYVLWRWNKGDTNMWNDVLLLCYALSSSESSSEIMLTHHSICQDLKLLVRLERLWSPQHYNRSKPGRCSNQITVMNLWRRRDLLHINSSCFKGKTYLSYQRQGVCRWS